MKTYEILVVEDELSMQTLLRHIFTKAGYGVSIVSNGNEARELLKKKPFDLVCSDFMVSGLDGIQLCRWVKEESNWRTIPVVIVSARAQAADREQGKQAGADAYVTKPFGAQNILETVQNLLMGHR